jgi:hypothetical protein
MKGQRTQNAEHGAGWLVDGSRRRRTDARLFQAPDQLVGEYLGPESIRGRLSKALLRDLIQCRRPAS